MKTAFMTLLCLLGICMGFAICVWTYNVIQSMAVVSVFLHAIVVGGSAYG